MALFAERYLYRGPDPKIGKREYILWPVYAWRVVYPASARLGANLFQESILGLISAGIIDFTEIAKLLALDAELVKFIVATQLQPNGWLDSRGKITQYGKKLLDDADDSRNDLSLGYAFQNAVTGSWLPRLTTNLSEIASEIGIQNSWPKFRLDKDKGNTISPFVIHHKVEASFQIKDLQTAFIAYRKDLSLARQERGFDTDDAIHFQGIDCVDETPTSLYLMCELYRDDGKEQPWFVADPFRLRKAASWLRKPMLELARSQRPLAEKLQKLIPEIASENCSIDDWFKQVEEQTNFELMVEFDYLCKHEMIFKYLSSVLRQIKKIESQGKLPHGEEVRSLLNDTPCLVEAVLTWLLIEWSISTAHWPKEGNWSPSQAKDELSSLKASYLSSSVINALSRQKRRDITNAIKNQGQALKALLAGTLFCADQHDTHPYNSLTKEELAFDRIMDVTNLRNKNGAHASLKNVSVDDVCKEAKFVIQWLEQFKSWY